MNCKIVKILKEITKIKTGKRMRKEILMYFRINSYLEKYYHYYNKNIIANNLSFKDY